jgi:hypothetical protein
MRTKFAVETDAHSPSIDFCEGVYIASVEDAIGSFASPSRDVGTFNTKKDAYWFLYKEYGFEQHEISYSVLDICF